MTTRAIAGMAALALLTGPALAQGGGNDRQAAGGAFNSSYSQGPYAPDNRSPAYDPGYGGTRSYEPNATGSIRQRSSSPYGSAYGSYGR